MLVLEKEHTNGHIPETTPKGKGFTGPELSQKIGLNLPNGDFIEARGTERLAQWGVLYLLQRKLVIFDAFSKICRGNDNLAFNILSTAKKPVNRVGDFMRTDIVNHELAYPFVKKGIFNYFHPCGVSI